MSQPISTKVPNIRASFQGALFLLLLLTGINAGFGASTDQPAQSVTVAKILDGDTVILADGRHVRLIGINAPETGKKDRPEQPLARQAKKYLQSLLRTGRIKLTPGKQPRDHYGRTLRSEELV